MPDEVVQIARASNTVIRCIREQLQDLNFEQKVDLLSGLREYCNSRIINKMQADKQNKKD